MNDEERLPPPSEPDDSHDTDGSGRSSKPSQASRLVELAEARYRFGRDPGGDLFAVPLTGPPIVRMLRGAGSSLRSSLAEAFAAEHGAAPSTSSLASALLVLEGRALRAETEPLALRVGEHEGRVVIDRGDETGRAIVVDADGWEVVSSPPLLFRRSTLTGRLPEPERGGTLEELRGLVHVADDAWPLAVGWLLLAFLPNVPTPILFFRGAHGAGKSSAARLFSRLVDPSAAQLRSAPRDAGEWTITASSSRVVPLDNISRLPEWLGDALCRVVTGDGLARRALYSDSDVVVFTFKRAVCLTAIAIEGVRGDLADRLLPIELERISETERKTEAELELAFQAAWPRLLGALCDLLAGVLRELPTTRPERLPRLADAARVFAALDTVQGGTAAFDGFCGVAGRLAHEVVEDDPVADAIRTLLADRGTWEGKTKDLLATITPEDKPRGWPESVQALTGRLTRAEEALRLIGIDIDRGHEGKGASKRRIVRITMREVEGQPSSASSASSQTVSQSRFRADDGVGRGSDEGPRGSDEADEGRTRPPSPSSDPENGSTMPGRGGGSDEADEGVPLFSCEHKEERGSCEWLATAGLAELAAWEAEIAAEGAQP